MRWIFSINILSLNKEPISIQSCLKENVQSSLSSLRWLLFTDGWSKCLRDVTFRKLYRVLGKGSRLLNIRVWCLILFYLCLFPSLFISQSHIEGMCTCMWNLLSSDHAGTVQKWNISIYLLRDKHQLDGSVMTLSYQQQSRGSRR